MIGELILVGCLDIEIRKVNVNFVINFPAHPLPFSLGPFSFHFYPLDILSPELLYLFARFGLFTLTAVDPFSRQAAIPLGSHRQHNRGSVSVW